MKKSLLILFAALLISGLETKAISNADINTGIETIRLNDSTYSLSSEVLLLSTDKSLPASPYIFSDPVQAFKAIDRSKAANIKLLVQPGVYWLDNPDDPAIRRNPSNSGAVPYAVEICCDTLSVIGLTCDPQDVVFAVNRGQTQGALGNYTMLHFTGRSLTVENITFGNYCNVDLVYPRDPSLNRAKRRDAIVQAQLGICDNTDRLFARNCRFISRLNLCPLIGARRSLYKDCYFECTDDALTGSAVYLDCRFTFYSGKPFYSTASTGAIFLNCDIHTLVNGTQYLTKVPGIITMIDTRWTSDHPVNLQWTRDLSPTHCYQSNVTLNGKPVFIDASRPALSSDISKMPLLQAYKITDRDKTIYNTPNLLMGNDGWDPLNLLPVIKDLETRSATPLTDLPVALRITASAKRLKAQNDTIELAPSFRRWGDYTSSMGTSPLTWSTPTTLSLIKSGDRTAAVSANNFPRDFNCTVSAKSPFGLTGATDVEVAAFLKPAPPFTSSPEISAEKASLNLSYGLSGSERDDSYIIWYRSTKSDLSDSVAVRHGRGLAGRSYPLTCADKGFFISASVHPKEADTRQGLPMTVKLPEAVTTKMLRPVPKAEKRLMTSFAEIPIRKGTPGQKGFWHFDSFKPADTKSHDWTPDEDKSWYYGYGTDAATGIGIVQATRGARMSYTPTREKSRNMKVSLIVEPCKGPGQGFGSATGQYMDICLKFNPVTLSGYALRIERTPDYDKAVTFTLVSYKNGIVSPVTEPIASNCYRNPCTIVIELRGNTLTALAGTDAPAVTATDMAIKPHVSLSATVEPTEDSSLMIQHTGSTGASASLIRDLNVTWE